MYETLASAQTLWHCTYGQIWNDLQDPSQVLEVHDTAECAYNQISWLSCTSVRLANFKICPNYLKLVSSNFKYHELLLSTRGKVKLITKYPASVGAGFYPEPWS